MAEVRNMSAIAKMGLLAETLSAKALEHFKAFHEELNRYTSNPAYMMEWGEALYGHAAKWKFHAVLAEICSIQAKADEAADVTVEQLQDMALRHFRPRGRHHSSSASSNNMAAHLDEVVLEFIFGHSWSQQWFRNAQRADPEYRAWWEQEAAKHKAEQIAKVRAETAALKQRDAARHRARIAVAGGTAPKHEDLLLGWPTPDDTRSIRDSRLKAHAIGALTDRAYQT